MSKQVKSLWHKESSCNIAQQDKPSSHRTAAGDPSSHQQSTEAAESSLRLQPQTRPTLLQAKIRLTSKADTYMSVMQPNRRVLPLRPPSPGQ